MRDCSTSFYEQVSYKIGCKPYQYKGSNNRVAKWFQYYLRDLAKRGRLDGGGGSRDERASGLCVCYSSLECRKTIEYRHRTTLSQH